MIKIADKMFTYDNASVELYMSAYFYNLSPCFAIHAPVYDEYTVLTAYSEDLLEKGLVAINPEFCDEHGIKDEHKDLFAEFVHVDQMAPYSIDIYDEKYETLIAPLTKDIAMKFKEYVG